jgi:starvation-inducible DNA-binding protein
MLDPQVDAVRLMVDEIAERIATLGGSPVGTPGALVAERTWDDYSLGRADAIAHLAALDVVYTGIIANHRQAMEKLEDLDLVTQDMLIEQLEKLEQFQWFVRAHVENADGSLATAGAPTERLAARRAEQR